MCEKSVKQKTQIAVLLALTMVLSNHTICVGQINGKNVQHEIVYFEEGRYGGWPANHGVWAWDNEILVGFVDASYTTTSGLHTYDPSSASNKYARSLDGGVTWKIEDAFSNGQTAWGHDNNISSEKAVKPVPLTSGNRDFTDPHFAMTFLRHNNHNGPSHFYYSFNKGASWDGPYELSDLNTPGIATRTDYIVDGPMEISAFITVAKSNKREGRVALARTTDGGVNWELVSYITQEQDGFDIMSSSLRFSPAELFTTIRTRKGDGQDLISSYRSNDNGKTWSRLKDPVADTGRGGSPPALVQLEDGRLALGYIRRSQNGSSVHVKFSDNKGESWTDEITLRSGDGANRDVGYPRLIQRPDGKLVMVYYWNNVLNKVSQPYRYIAATIFNPKDWE